MQLLDRKEEGVHGNVVETLHLGFQTLAERAIGVGKDRELARSVALDLLDRDIERQRLPRHPIHLAHALLGEISARCGVVHRTHQDIIDLGVGIKHTVVELRFVQAEIRRLGHVADRRARKPCLEKLFHRRDLFG